LKSLIKRALLPLIRNDKSWKVLRRFVVAGAYMNNHREQMIRDRNPLLTVNQEEKEFDFLFPAKSVLHGPFKGLKYPYFSSVCSMLYPKLIGSYEKELHPFINRFLQTNYSEILDIGCAEGYYAIGFSLNKPDTKVFAFDIDENARNLCYEMARANGVTNRVNINASCTADDLKEFKFSGKALIISDCEGYEMRLFTEENVSNLRNCDILIETHDFININITSYLIELFAQTHNVEVIKSIDDIEKAKTYLYPETEQLNLQQRKDLFAECRPGVMEWLVCTPKSN
jgi:precorrin-6B methylase 2